MHLRDARARTFRRSSRSMPTMSCIGLGTFETDPPDAHEMQARMAQVTAAGFPDLVATDGNEVFGYAYANHSVPRGLPLHRGGLDLRGTVCEWAMGPARSLLNETARPQQQAGTAADACRHRRLDNAASIGVHRACGFEHVGTMTAVGRKFDRWIDVVIMQRALAT